MFGLFLLFFGVFTTLSVWQVQRVYEKQGIADRIELAQQQQRVEINADSGATLVEHEFYAASAYGHFLVERCFYVENVIREGRPGLYLYCPFELRDHARILLVNMGWMARPKQRFDLPAIEVDASAMRIDGIIKRPRSTPVVVNDNGVPNIELDHLWAYFDFEFLNRTLDGKVYPVEFQLTSDIRPRMEREWSAYDPKIGMHIGYAIHWAAFALVTLGLFLKFNVKKDG
jgi:surfeit locus 1 family protein